jgi:phenylpropionate dioxygenase-like ring-hydroxylating dioxygenase large terminal subunit
MNTIMLKSQRIFNNPDVVAKGWYFGCLSREVPMGKAKSIDLCNQRIVLFRGEDGAIRALDAYCPHLGTDLGIGRVEGNKIRCFFHH